MGIGSVVKSVTKAVTKAATSIVGGASGIATGMVLDAITQKKPKVKADTGALRAEAAATANLRKNLFATDYGILGEEVSEVGNTKRRGSILGN